MKGVTLLFLVTLTAFLSDVTDAATCPLAASLGCFCQNGVVDCTNKNLDAVPPFSSAGWDQFTIVRLSKNNITSVPSNAFLHINVTTIELDYNNINHIATDAFAGISNYLTTLDLEGNKLIAASEAFKHLPHLTSLNILHNPVRSVPDPVLYALGSTLLDFSFGDDGLDIWPTTLNHLQTLKSLRFEGLGMKNIPFAAFHGFELTLRKLTLRRTGISAVPRAIKELLYLEELYFEDNINVHDSGIIESAFQTARPGGGSPIQTLSLKNNSLSTFPTALKELPELTTFIMDDNRLWYINDAMVSYVRGYMFNVSLRGCSLDRVPQAILRIKHLQNLDLSKNNINSIYSNDFTFNDGSLHHEHLKFLNLASNPLAYIASTSFERLAALTEVNITSTALKAIPCALGNVPSLSKVYVHNTPVECTCDLKWIQATEASHVTFEGECETITQNIQDYITKRIPLCPNDISSRTRCRP
ncbi:leucine-rich repeat and immunoglobulin-like domain-containing nogo receptor-interacting protein 2 [Ylistrum balloti]|uniref:leucine-rich repeat and immunoglobulin-like domain-containing nogo receptor-interacting protein 2 n=1 Tax=Ylistrum balloti TaxID=509963 RepID=UPI0029058563|nr:leucine-rich repeat and immunoglobulin-like domain-containing nogo receptor-interacting protein 2 [Ylistrum balloti]